MRPTNKYTGKVITSIKDEWQMNDEYFSQYFERLDIEAHNAGFDVKPGYCPLLMAEEELRQAKHRLIDAMEPITRCSCEKLICSGLKKYDRMVDLALRLLAPFVANYRKRTS